jgi:hypothetical protein
VARLKGTPSKIAVFLEESPDQPLNIGEAILKLKAFADKNPELAEAIQEVEAEVERNPNIAKQVQILSQAMQSRSPTVQNSDKLAEYIQNLFQGNNFFGSVTFN